MEEREKKFKERVKGVREQVKERFQSYAEKGTVVKSQVKHRNELQRIARRLSQA